MRIGLAAWTVLVVAFLWLPLLLIALYAFNSSNIQDWPISGLSTKWFGEAWDNQEVRDALVPVAIITLYLILMRRLGAFEAL